MKVQEWLEKVAKSEKTTGFDSIGDPDDIPDSYVSKFDGSYITFVGFEDDSLLKFLAEHKVTESLTNGVGFSPTEQKWYGWSHRAIYGFTIGSTCGKGDCHYVADTPEGLINDHAEFFANISQERADEKRAECQILDDRSGIRILHSQQIIPIAESIDEALESIGNDEIGSLEAVDIAKDAYSVVKCGRGEWTAETLEDAKQMAIDFSIGVS